MKYCAACEGENHAEFGVALGRFISFTEGLGTKRCCEDLGRKASGHSVSLLGVHELIVILLPLLFSSF